MGDTCSYKQKLLTAGVPIFQFLTGGRTGPSAVRLAERLARSDGKAGFEWLSSGRMWYYKVRKHTGGSDRRKGG